MTHDPEAAWPLTQLESGYYPSTAPPPLPNSLVPRPPTSPVVPTPHLGKSMSAGVRIAILSIILTASIPLTAIAANYANLIGIAVVWLGIVMVSGIVFGRPGK